MALGSGRRGGSAFFSAHGELLRLEANQVKSSPLRVCALLGSREARAGGNPGSASRGVATGPARGDRGARSAPAPALAPALTAFLPLSPSSCRRLGRDGGAGPAAVPLRHRDQPGAG